METLKSHAPDLEPQRILEALDYEEFTVPDAKGFLVLVNAWRKLTSGEPFPLQASHSRARRQRLICRRLNTRNLRSVKAEMA